MSKLNLLANLALGAGMGVLYLLFNSFIKKGERAEKKAEEEKREELTLEMTRQIAQEIKYQMLVACITYAKKFDKTYMEGLSPAQWEISDGEQRKCVANLYEQKQAIILRKFQVQKELYAQNLNKYESDDILSRNKTEIMKMMEQASKGRMPDFSVPQEALDYKSPEQLVEIYSHLTEIVVISVWEKIVEFIKKDPEFDVTDSQHFSRMIRQVGVYRLKAKFLLEKGFQIEWGCPNEILLKVIESIRSQNQGFSRKISAIEASYEQSLRKTAQSPLELDSEKIKTFYNSEILRFRLMSEIQSK